MYTLIDPEKGESRPDDGAILAPMIVADRDTSGPNRFINEQVRRMPSFARKAMDMPDIGHFIKSICNSFYALAWLQVWRWTSRSLMPNMQVSRSAFGRCLKNAKMAYRC